MWGRMTRRRRRLGRKTHVEAASVSKADEKRRNWTAEGKEREKDRPKKRSPGQSRRIPTCARRNGRRGDQGESGSGPKERGCASMGERDIS